MAQLDLFHSDPPAAPAGVIHERDPLLPEESARLRRSARSQEERISAWFQRHPAARLTAWEVSWEIFRDNEQITSVRRALNTLANQGELCKYEETKPGPLGVRCHVYGLPEKEI